MDATNRFSPCTIGNICSGFASKQVSQSCLTSNKNVTLITAGECGNGIVEEGEECDCGGTAGCAGDTCCDPTTCKFTTGSVCDDSNDACCKNCQFASSTTVCRASVDVTCDPVEYCPGNSSSCPADVTTADGTSCGNGLQCAGGTCTSRDLQCQQAINGSTGSCDDTSCMLSCSSTTLGPNTCLLVLLTFIDGTPCGIGLSGTCDNGSCENQSTGAAIGNWIANVLSLPFITNPIEQGYRHCHCVGARRIITPMSGMLSLEEMLWAEKSSTGIKQTTCLYATSAASTTTECSSTPSAPPTFYDLLPSRHAGLQRTTKHE